MFRAAFIPIAVSSIALIAGCDSDNDSSSSNNGAPTVTSAATASVPENSTGTIYTATATDPDGDAVTFFISGGPDGNRFQITSAGALSFVTPPDFETPGDVGADNVYDVQIAATDGTDSRALNVKITVTNAGTDAFKVTRVATGFASPTFLAPYPDGSGRVVVVERAGRIVLLNPTNGTTAPFLDLTGQTTTDGERGVLGFATAPNFATSGVYYVSLTNLAGDLEVRRFSSAAGSPPLGDVILVVPHPGENNHNGGWIGFGNDGFLYVSTGDGGGAGDPANNAQNTNVLLGKVLRVDVATDAFPADANRDYAIPTSNPFATTGGAPEVWLYGLRNPYRASFDAVTGNLWIGDVGQSAREEIDLARPQDGGTNFGWRVMEGTTTFNGTPTASMMRPIAEYEHGTGERQGNSVTGGYVYRGPVESLRGQYFFGDYITGNIFSINTATVVQGTTIPAANFTLRKTAFTPNAGVINNISSFGVDQAGNLYIVDFDGEIFRLEVQ